MDPLYRPIFKGMEQTLAQQPDYAEVLRAIQAEEQRILAPRNMRLREDATIFLAVNFVTMLISPWQQAHPGQKFSNNYPRLINNDVGALLNLAVDLAIGRATTEISARIMLEPLTTHYHRFALSSQQIWG
jgi:hypothetical protein